MDVLEARPLPPARAWGLLDLLDGGDAEWLDAAHRAVVLAMTAALVDAPAPVWRTVLASRSLTVRCQAPPQALDELDRAPGEILFVARRGATGPGVVEMYADTDAWMWMQPRVLMGSEVRGEGNLLVRVPQTVWPFRDGVVGACASAADALEHPDERVVMSAVAVLNHRAAGAGAVQPASGATSGSVPEGGQPVIAS